MTNPSTRRVARKLRQAGQTVSHTTVARWHTKGWRPLERQRHPLEVARADLNDAAPLLTGHPFTAVKTLLDQSAEREELAQLSDSELLRRAAREALIAIAVIARELTRRTDLVTSRTRAVAVLFRALAAMFRAAALALGDVTRMQSQSAAGPGTKT